METAVPAARAPAGFDISQDCAVALSRWSFAKYFSGLMDLNPGKTQIDPWQVKANGGALNDTQLLI